MNPTLATLIIEAKQGAYDLIYSELSEYANALKEAVHEPGLDEKDRETLKGKSDLIYGLLDDISPKFDSHIEEVKERYEEQCSNTSTNYLANLKNWTPSA